MTDSSIYSINGTIVDESKATISLNDIGIVRGFGVFDYLITYNRKPFFLDAHIQRLYRSAKVINLSLPVAPETITQWVDEAVASHSTLDEKQIRIIATGGIGPDSVTPNDDAPTIAVIISPRNPNPKEYYTDGIAVETSSIFRQLYGAKTLNYTEAISLLLQARKTNSKEVLYTKDGYVLEGSTSNLFAVIDGELVTPKDDILPGITREVILNHLSLAFQINQRAIRLSELQSATEVFITASNKEIMPVTILDGRKISDGKVGPVTKKVFEAFETFTQRN